MIRIWNIFLLTGVIGFFSSCEKQSVQPDSDYTSTIEVHKVVVNGNNDCGEPYVTSLFTAEYIFVGTLTVVQTGKELTISYDITEAGFGIVKTHLDISDAYNEFPVNSSGNPMLEEFDFVDDFETPVTSVTYNLNIDGLSSVSIAAQAVVIYADETDCVGIVQIEDLLPDSLVYLSWKYSKTDSYYKINISNAGLFDGEHLGWCADNNWAPVNYPNATLVSSYDTSLSLLSGIVDHPENLDLLNYLMNTYFENQPFPVIQSAVWTLLNGFYENTTGGIELTHEQEETLALVMENVYANGEGFVPECGQDMVILINSGDSKSYQNCFIMISLSEEIQTRSEIVWGYGNPFGGESGAMYFDYCLNAEEKEY